MGLCMKKNSEKKKMNFLLKALIYIGVLLLIFVVTILGTKYYFYDSDSAIKKTDLSAVSVDDIKLGQNIQLQKMLWIIVTIILRN